jgi:inorganic pyrophosphatase
MGSRHPHRGYVYPVNYGYVSGVIAPDGDELDAYLLGVEQPVDSAEGVVRAVIHPRDDDDDKLVVIPEGMTLDDAEIKPAVDFQERFFVSEVVRAANKL